MKTALLCAALLWSGGMLAQNPAPTRSGAANGAMELTELPAGVAMAAELSKSIDARKAKTGDPIQARTTQDMLSNGKIVIPHDSKITGHITEAQPRPKGQKGEAASSIGIAFDQLTLKGGQQIPLHADIQAIAKPLQVAAAGGEAPGGGTLAAGGYPGTASSAGPGAAPGTAPGSMPVGAPSTHEPANGNGSAGQESSSGPAGAISVQNQGVIGMKGFSLSSNEQGAVISSNTENVKLDGGTQLILKTKGK